MIANCCGILCATESPRYVAIILIRIVAWWTSFCRFSLIDRRGIVEADMEVRSSPLSVSTAQATVSASYHVGPYGMQQHRGEARGYVNSGRSAVWYTLPCKSAFSYLAHPSSLIRSLSAFRYFDSLSIGWRIESDIPRWRRLGYSLCERGLGLP